jgi:hypothetical protein
MGSANSPLLTSDGRQMLMVFGNQGDAVDLADGTGTAGWTQNGYWRGSPLGDLYLWFHDTSLVTVYVQSGVLVT